VTALFQRIIEVDAEETRPLFWSCVYFFFILASYYIIRPVRDEMGLAGGVEYLPWLFTGTLVTMLVVNPPFAALVARLPRLRFVALTYRFFILNLLLFFILFKIASESQNVWLGRAFYVWTSVFQLFVVSVFWAFMADTFSTSQAKRLFGVIAFGGTFGAMVGSSLTAGLVVRVGAVNLLLLSALFIEIGVRSMRRLSSIMEAPESLTGDSPGPDEIDRERPSGDGVRSRGEPIGGGALAGIANVFRSSYLLGISGYMFLFTFTATLLYFQQAELVEGGFVDRAARTAVFARIDLAVNLVTAFTQLFLTARVMRVFGIGATLALLPALCIFGFSVFGLLTTFAVLVVFQVLRRSGNFALSRPAREALFIVLSREDKYKAKSFVDTFVYRLGDQLGAWTYTGMRLMGLTMGGIAFTGVPLAMVWLIVAIWLGRRQEKLAKGA
jgi:AAA family ATP:ADP antiporter